MNRRILAINIAMIGLKISQTTFIIAQEGQLNNYISQSGSMTLNSIHIKLSTKKKYSGNSAESIRVQWSIFCT
ncbi:MAG: hypothetical protein ACRD5J_18530, partial [Nitrososphaeraceae archaeon]